MVTAVTGISLALPWGQSNKQAAGTGRTSRASAATGSGAAGPSPTTTPDGSDGTTASAAGEASSTQAASADPSGPGANFATLSDAPAANASVLPQLASLRAAIIGNAAGALRAQATISHEGVLAMLADYPAAAERLRPLA